MFSLTAVYLMITQIQGYWVSQNRLNWYDAAIYCKTQCNSSLASIHNVTQHRQAQNITYEKAIWVGFDFNSTNTWIGLTSPDDDLIFIWNDSSPWDFGTDTTISPWKENSVNINNNTKKCVVYTYDWCKSPEWEENDCSLRRRFMCNSCEGHLDKYIVFDSLHNYTKALYFCEDMLATSLATIHNDDDTASTKYLCEKMGGNCWIGLNRVNDTGNLTDFSQFEWTDNTLFESEYDYGWYPNLSYAGDGPWATNQPDDDMEEQDCVQLNANQDYKWDDRGCDNRRYPICLVENEFWYNYEFRNIYRSSQSFYSCYESVCGTPRNEGWGTATGVLGDRRWTNNNWPLRIEYSFIVHSVKNIGEYADVGMVIYHMGTSTGGLYNKCDHYFIGIGISNASIIYLEYYKSRNGFQIEYYTSETFDVTLEYGRQYTIDVELDRDSEGEEIKISWQLQGIVPQEVIHDGDAGIYDYISSDKYIGITNENSNVTGKYLYISGTPEYTFYNYSYFPLSSCEPVRPFEPTGPTTINPTPTLMPSVTPNTDGEPTVYPTSDPTHDHAVNIIITFEYESNSKDIIDILTNITITIINRKLTSASICINDQEYDIKVVLDTSNNASYAIITTTLNVCNEQDEIKLRAESVPDELRKSFLNETSEYPQLIVKPETVSIQSSGVNDYTTTMQSTQQTVIKSREDETWYIWVIVGFVGVVCILSVIYGYIRFKKHKMKEQTNTLKEKIEADSGGYIESDAIVFGRTFGDKVDDNGNTIEPKVPPHVGSSPERLKSFSSEEKAGEMITIDENITDNGRGDIGQDEFVIESNEVTKGKVEERLVTIDENITDHGGHNLDHDEFVIENTESNENKEVDIIMTVDENVTEIGGNKLRQDEFVIENKEVTKDKKDDRMDLKEENKDNSYHSSHSDEFYPYQYVHKKETSFRGVDNDEGDTAPADKTKKYLDWNHEDILEWIMGLENGMFVQYKDMLSERLMEEDIKGKDLGQVDKGDIRGWGITKFEHKQKLFEHIEVLTLTDEGQ